MNKVKTFLHVLQNSLFPRGTYYKKIQKAPFSFSLKYFAALITVIVALVILVLGMKTVSDTGTLNWLRGNVTALLNQYPDDLVIVVKEGRLLSSLDRPVFFWFDQDGVPSPIIVVDERGPFERIFEYDALFMVNSDGIATRDDGKLAIYRFRTSDSFNIDKQDVETLGKTLSLFLDAAPLILLVALPIIIVILAAVVLGAKLATLAFLSLIAFLALRSWTKKVSFKKVYQLSLHASTLPLIVEFGLLSFGPRIAQPMFPNVGRLVPGSPLSLFVILNLVFILAAVYETYLVKREKGRKR